jgi:hypothetical protein
MVTRNSRSILKAIGELVRALAPGWNIRLAMPSVRARLEFNTYGVYDHEEFARCFAPHELVEFAFIEERGLGGLIVAAPPKHVREESWGFGRARKRNLAPLAFRQYKGCCMFNCQTRCAV